LRLYYRDAANSIIASRAADGPANRVDGRAPARYFFKSWHLNRNLDYLSRDPRELAKTLLDVWITGLATRGSILEVARDGKGTLPLLLRLAALPVGLIAYWYCCVRELRRRPEEDRAGALDPHSEARCRPASSSPLVEASIAASPVPRSVAR
jgi:hypothetical protein